MSERESPTPKRAEVWATYEELESRTGDSDYGSTVEHYRKLGHESVDYAYVRNACELKRLRRDGSKRLWHHLRKLLRPAYWFNFLWVLDLRLHGVKVGSGVFCKGRVDIERSGGRISIGDRVQIDKYVLLQTSPHGVIDIHNDVRINRFNLISCDCGITVEENCVFAPYVRLVDAEHSFRDRSLLIKNTRGTSAPVRVGRGTWLAFGVTVLKGVEIGEGAVVGAGAVVKDDIPAFAIAVGVPSRTVAYRE